MKLSVIIPVYRADATLKRCVESVLSQGCESMEVILVDDGSPDDCPRQCDDWAQRDARIRTIHKANGGLSDARNAGLEIATGDYLTFVDADDYLAPNTYQQLMKQLCESPETDLLEYPAYIRYGASDQHRLTFRRQTFNDATKYWYATQAYEHCYACNKLYRASLFDGIRFPVGRVFEDTFTLPQLLKKARRISTTNTGLYYYLPNPKGITMNADGKALQMLLESHLEMLHPVAGQEAAFERYYLRVMNIQMDVYEQTGDRPILPPHTLNPQYFKGTEKLKAITLNILGINKICKLNKIFHILWRSH